MTTKELKQRAGVIPFARRLKLVGGFAACPFHEGDSDQSFHVLRTESGIFIGTCFSECNKSWNALDFVADFDKVSIARAIRRVTAELAIAGDAVQADYEKKDITPMTAAIWKMGRAVTADDAACLAASRPQSATPSAETLNAVGFKMNTAGFLCCAYRLGDTFYTVKCRRLTTKDFMQANAVSQHGLFNIDAVSEGCDVAVVESELDVAVLYEQGLTAVSVMYARQRVIEPEVMKKLLTAGRINLVGDNDTAGIECMDAIAKLLPPKKVYRTPLVGAKDIGEVVFKRLYLPMARSLSKNGSRLSRPPMATATA
jgi:DNA primase